MNFIDGLSIIIDYVNVGEYLIIVGAIGLIFGFNFDEYFGIIF